MSNLTKKNKEKWLKALRSGKYQHGTGQLRYEDRFCCIGVYCEIFKIPYDGVNTRIEASPDIVGESFYPGVDEVLGFSVVKELTNLNDRNKDFSKIIEYIEQNL